MKRIVGTMLCLSLILSISSSALAVDNSTSTSAQTHTSSFIDGEGKENSVEITIPQVGSSHVAYYIDGILVNTVNTTIENGQAFIELNDARTSTTRSFTEPVSNYITEGETTTVTTPSARGYTYLGKIAYNPYYDSNGSYYDHYLTIYQEAVNTTNEYKTLHAEEGATASVVIGVIAAALTIPGAPLAFIAESLLYAAAYAAGTTIVGGIVQGLISKTYYTLTTTYDVIAIYPPTSRQIIFEGERYQVALEGGGYSSEYYYDGYLPWNDEEVALMFYESFWGAAYYPGVKNFS